ncbi:MAG: hypothetical protein WC208_11505 [Gallionella sp.]|jgi:hypothetical protein
MTTAIEYALMAGVSYRSNRDPKNRFPIPQDWSEVVGSYRNLTSASGFEAVSFQNSTNPNEIVISISISISGTDPTDYFGDVAADPVTGAAAISADAMVTRFTTDKLQ